MIKMIEDDLVMGVEGSGNIEPEGDLNDSSFSTSISPTTTVASHVCGCGRGQGHGKGRGHGRENSVARWQKWGFKYWIIADPTGYTVDFDVYEAII